MTLMGMEIGGAETHVLELSKTLQRMGLDVHVVSNGGVYVEELLECGIKHYRVPLHNKQFINVFSSYKALKKIIIENDIRLVHAHARIPAFICGLLKKRLDFRLVTTAHLNFSVAFPFNLLSNWGDKTLAVSGDIKDYLLANYKIEERIIEMTVNGVDTKKFTPGLDVSDITEEFGLAPDTRKIVSISRLDKDRSLPAHLLIELAEEMAQAATVPIEFIIVGDGDDFGTIKRKADEVNKRARKPLIHLTGSRTDINKFGALADIFVNVSRSALEAMSGGAPVIIAGNQGYLGVLDEKTKDLAVATNFTCRNCGETTREKLGKDLLSLINMPKKELSALGLYGRKLAESEYSLERMATDAIRVYEDVLSPDFSASKSVNVVISGYYGYDNSGDDIILHSILQNLRDLRGDLNFTVLSIKPKETRARFKVNTVYRFNLFQVFFRLRKADLLITGGGNLIQDETSTQSLMYYLWIINTARRLGAKNMLYAKGIGPVSRPGNIKRVKKALDRVNLITLRESDSLEVIKEIGITGPDIHVAADAAFALPPAAGGEALLSAKGIRRPFFCVALRSWKHNPDGLDTQVALFADHLAETYGYQAVFVQMCPEQDRELSCRVMSLMRHPAVLVETEPDEFNQDRTILGLASFALCMRLHALIFAMEKGVPTIGLVYSPKIRQFMETMGQKWHMPVEETSADTLIEFSDQIHSNIDGISAEIYDSACRLRELAALNAKLCVELICDA